MTKDDQTQTSSGNGGQQTKGGGHPDDRSGSD
jgi:hypothetical protein